MPLSPSPCSAEPTLTDKQTWIAAVNCLSEPLDLKTHGQVSDQTLFEILIGAASHSDSLEPASQIPAGVPSGHGICDHHITHRVQVDPQQVHQHYRDRFGIETVTASKITVAFARPPRSLCYVSYLSLWPLFWFISGALCFGLTSASLNAMDGAFCRRTFDRKPCWSFSRMPLNDISPGVVR
ncbi:MAG: hypothetical protein F6K00_18470 [Leptolyngbya sp. SIOISBB]|nr:hypothetical protein [Leptolyngbya sp. SIOISBB]